MVFFKKQPGARILKNFFSGERSPDMLTVLVYDCSSFLDELKLMEALYHIVTQHVHMIRVREAPRKSATLENILNKLNCKNFGQCYGIVPESFA